LNPKLIRVVKNKVKIWGGVRKQWIRMYGILFC